MVTNIVVLFKEDILKRIRKKKEQNEEKAGDRGGGGEEVSQLNCLGRGRGRNVLIRKGLVLQAIHPLPAWPGPPQT